jgi:ectoine hydroxylase-related dioxygenase (phytanoyl-CoA dioxygenase family)
MEDASCVSGLSWRAMTTSIPAQSFITEEQKQRFLEDGFIRLDNVIPQEDLDWYRGRYDELFASDPSEVKRKKLGGSDDKGRDTLPQILRPSDTMPELKERTTFKRIAGIARFIHGPEMQFRNDHMIMKPAGYGTATPWHQDQAYHDPARKSTSINFWFPLEDATVEGGCMQYVRWSHRGTMLPHEYLVPGDPQSALVTQNQEFWQANATALACPAGSVCLHHSYCLHYAGPNRTDRPRRAYIMVFALPPVELDRPFCLPWLKDTGYRVE